MLSLETGETRPKPAKIVGSGSSRLSGSEGSVGRGMDAGSMEVVDDWSGVEGERSR